MDSKNLSFEQLYEHPIIVQHVHRSLKLFVSTNNLGLSTKEIPKVIRLVKEEWSQDNNLLTAAMKMKRREVNEYYRKEIEQMFIDE